MNLMHYKLKFIDFFHKHFLNEEFLKKMFLDTRQ